MGLFSSILGTVGSLFGQSRSIDAASSQQSTAIEANREFYQNRHQWEVADLKKAGLNPILSANSAGGSGIGATASAGASADIGSAINAVTNSASRRRELDIADKNAEAALKQAEASQMNAATKSRETDSQIKLNDSTIGKQSSDIEVNKSLINFQAAQTAYMQNKQVLETAMNHAEIREIDQRIQNSVLELAGKLELWQKEGNAALTNAEANRMMAATAEANGISLRQLQAALGDTERSKQEELASRVQVNAADVELKGAQAFKNRASGQADIANDVNTWGRTINQAYDFVTGVFGIGRRGRHR